MMEKLGLEQWKALASIASSVAVPIVLAVVGYFVQRQLASEGLKKDYVQIAVSILKEDPARQDADLRRWAVRIVDENSPVPLGSAAKRSLENSQLLTAEDMKLKRCVDIVSSRVSGGLIPSGDSERWLRECLAAARPETSGPSKVPN